MIFTRHLSTIYGAVVIWLCLGFASRLHLSLCGFPCSTAIVTCSLWTFDAVVMGGCSLKPWSRWASLAPGCSLAKFTDTTILIDSMRLLVINWRLVKFPLPSSKFWIHLSRKALQLELLINDLMYIELGGISIQNRTAIYPIVLLSLYLPCRAVYTDILTCCTVLHQTSYW